MAAIITMDNLGYNFGDGWVLHDLTLSIEAGDFVAVIGANGVEQVVEYNLPDNELAEFKECCATVRKNIAKGEKLVASGQ